MTNETELRIIEGSCAPGFEAVRDVFAAGANELGEGGGAFAVYVGGEKVVDLWAGWAAPGVPWAEDTLCVLASATKGLATLCVQMLFSRGDLDIEAPVASYWPEFAANGKERITVRQVLNHTSGVIGVPGAERFMRWDGTGWDDHEEIARCLAASAPAYEPGTQVAYHGLTYGWITGEIVRRIAGRSVGAFFADEIARPLGLDAYIGTPATEVDRVATTVQQDLSDLPIPDEFRPVLDVWLAEARDPSTLVGQAMLATAEECFLDIDAEAFWTPQLLAAEVPSSNGTSTARSLAKMYAVLAGGGEIDGTRFVSSGSIETFGAQLQGVPQAQILFAFTPPRALGYHGNFAGMGGPMVFGPNPEAFGHLGLGGGVQVGCCDPANEVAIGFVRSHPPANFPSTLASDLVGAVYENLPGGRA